jgi:hypothetical protein
VTREELAEEIGLELELMNESVREAVELREDVGNRDPTVREKTAEAAFLAQFYNGTENILKRICLYCGEPLPSGELWHAELLRGFFEPHARLPLLFDRDLGLVLSSFRKFRHVVHHGYGFQLDWERIREGICAVEDVFSQVRARVETYVRDLQGSP